MIILRQKEYGRKKSSVYWSQGGNNNAATILIENGKDIITDREDDYPRKYNKFYDRIKGDYNKNLAVELNNKGNFVFTNNQGKEVDGCGRLVPHTMVSNKSPREAYRDWLKSIDERMKRPDITESEPVFSNKEIKEQLRKAAKKRNIKKAAPWVIGGTLATGATVAGIKAYKKHKKIKRNDTTTTKRVWKEEKFSI